MGPMNITNTIIFLAFLLNAGLGILVYLRDSPHRRVNVSFSLFTWALAAWILSVSMSFLFREPAWRLFWARMSFVASSNIPSTFLYFSLIFPNEKRNISPLKILLIFSLSTIFTVFSFTKLMIRSAQWETTTLSYGNAYKFFSIYLVLGMAGGIFFLFKSLKNSIGLERIQIKYCFLGTFLTTLPAIMFNLFLPMLGTSRLSRLGPSSTLIMVSFITYAILKHRLMDINIVLKKGTTYVFLMFLLFIPLILISILSQELFFGKIDYVFSVIVFALLLVGAIFFEKVKYGTEKTVEQILFKNRYDYRETLSKLSKAMVSILDLQSLTNRIFETITQTMGVEKASLFLWDEEKGAYSLFESKNVNVTTTNPLLPKDDPLPRYLQKMGEIIIREELAKRGNIPELKYIVNMMSLMGAEASIPLISKGQLIGMLNLGYKFNKDIYSHEDIELLSTLANQTAIAVENARLYEDLKKSKSYIRRADRLASLGTLTAGLAHEIRNPLVSIKTLTQLLPERLEDEEFRDQFLKIASGEVDRIATLVEELLDLAKPSDPKLGFEDINTILDGMILLVSTETKKKKVDILRGYASDLPPVQIDREQMKQVFLNILLNAIQATSENGKITVKTRSFTKPGGEPFVQVECTDTGCGIPPENIEEIFNPFFTTKSTGSGLGLSISHQIIQEHQGYIDVESQWGRGSSFFINLPVSQNHPKRRKSDSESTEEIDEIDEK